MDKDEYTEAWSEDEPAKTAAAEAFKTAQAEDERAFGEGWGLSPDAPDAPESPKESPVAPVKETPKEPPRAAFKEAFAAARKAGQKQFEWNGKQYTTELKRAAKPAEKPAAKPVAAPPVVAVVAKPVAAPAAKPAAPAIKTLAPANVGEPRRVLSEDSMRRPDKPAGMGGSGK